MYEEGSLCRPLHLLLFFLSLDLFYCIPSLSTNRPATASYWLLQEHGVASKEPVKVCTYTPC